MEASKKGGGREGSLRRKSPHSSLISFLERSYAARIEDEGGEAEKEEKAKYPSGS